MRPLLLTILYLLTFVFVVQFDGTNCAKPDPKCSLPLESGPCRMKLARFYYNPTTKECEEFSYGGCRGNDNRFGIKGACESACKPLKK